MSGKEGQRPAISGFRLNLLAVANVVASTSRSLAVGLRPFRGLVALAILAWTPPESAMGVILRRVAEVSGDTLVESLLDWPMMVLLLVWMLGPSWIRRYLETIREVGGMRREAADLVTRGLDDLQLDEGTDEAS